MIPIGTNVRINGAKYESYEVMGITEGGQYILREFRRHRVFIHRGNEELMEFDNE